MKRSSWARKYEETDAKTHPLLEQAVQLALVLQTEKEEADQLVQVLHSPLRIGCDQVGNEKGPALFAALLHFANEPLPEEKQ